MGGWREPSCVRVREGSFAAQLDFPGVEPKPTGACVIVLQTEQWVGCSTNQPVKDDWYVNRLKIWQVLKCLKAKKSLPLL